MLANLGNPKVSFYIFVVIQFSSYLRVAKTAPFQAHVTYFSITKYRVLIVLTVVGLICYNFM